jgi:predicted nucleotidyltransferase component of viral defense system
VGGTALALQLGHRHSVDLDFFGAFDESTGPQMEEQLRQNGFDARLDYDTKTIKTFAIDGIKVDLVNYPVGWLEPPIEDEGVRMAGLKDIAAMKLLAITNRGRKKDFIDFYFLLQHFTPSQMLDFFLKKYHGSTTFNVMRSLCYFADAEKDDMPKMFVDVTWDEIKSAIRAVVSEELSKP